MGCETYTSKEKQSARDDIKKRLGAGVSASSYYTHPEYGEVQLPNQHFTASMNECRRLAYSNGLLVNGHRYYDKPAIEKHRKKYTQWKTKTLYFIFQQKMLEPDKPIDIALPEEFIDVHQKENALSHCVSKSGWEEIEKASSLKQQEKSNNVSPAARAIEGAVSALFEKLLK